MRLGWRELRPRVDNTNNRILEQSLLVKFLSTQKRKIIELSHCYQQVFTRRLELAIPIYV